MDKSFIAIKWKKQSVILETFLACFHEDPVDFCCSEGFEDRLSAIKLNSGLWPKMVIFVGNMHDLPSGKLT